MDEPSIIDMCNRARSVAPFVRTLHTHCSDHREVVDTLAHWLGIQPVQHTLLSAGMESTEVCRGSGARYIPSQRVVLWSWEAMQMYSTAFDRGQPLPMLLLYNAIHELMHADSRAAHSVHSTSSLLDELLEESLSDDRAWQVARAMGLQRELDMHGDELGYPYLRYLVQHLRYTLDAYAPDQLWNAPSHQDRIDWLRRRMLQGKLQRGTRDPLYTWLLSAKRTAPLQIRQLMPQSLQDALRKTPSATHMPGI